LSSVLAGKLITNNGEELAEIVANKAGAIA